MIVEIAWARRTSDGRIVGVDQVPSGLACECVCTQCEHPLVAAKGDVYRHHFRHHADGSTCGGGQETALHMLAKDIVMRAASIQLPDDDMRDITSAELEPTLGDVRPDVLIHTPKGDVAIEIAVEHRTGEVKTARLAAMNLAAVEIDISVYRGVLMSAEDARWAVYSTAARRWLRPRKGAGEAHSATEAEELDQPRRVRMGTRANLGPVPRRGHFTIETLGDSRCPCQRHRRSRTRQRPSGTTAIAASGARSVRRRHSERQGRALVLQGTQAGTLEPNGRAVRYLYTKKTMEPLEQFA